jgi:hypothetical protein
MTRTTRTLLAAVKPSGTSRPGLMIPVPLDGRLRIDLDVLGVECDGVLLIGNCLVEGGRWSRSRSDTTARRPATGAPQPR